MSEKKFGVWMDNVHAIVVGNAIEGEDSLAVIAHVGTEETAPNSSEKASNNQEKTLKAKYFKEIASHLTNATHVHLTGTGTAQEQFMHYLAETPQFKQTKATECTSNKMSDERLVEFIAGKLN